MKRKNYLLIWVFTVFAGMLFAVAPYVQGDDEGSYRLEGAWIRTSTLPPPLPTPTVRASFTLTPTVPSGKVANLNLVSLVADTHAQGICPKTYYLSALVGTVEMTGSKTWEGSGVAYGMRPPDPDLGEIRDQVECVWLAYGKGEFTGPDSFIGTDYLGVVNVDGQDDFPMIPDPEDMQLCVKLCHTNERVKIKPPCDAGPLDALMCPGE